LPREHMVDPRSHRISATRYRQADFETSHSPYARDVVEAPAQDTKSRVAPPTTTYRSLGAEIAISVMTFYCRSLDVAISLLPRYHQAAKNTASVLHCSMRRASNNS
jgi:hypothetical protein